MISIKDIESRGKFKAKSIITKDWVKGFFLFGEETTYCFEEDYIKNPVKIRYYIAQDSMTDWGLPNTFRLFEIDPETICEFTCLYDKEGNEIYENDIVLIENFSNKRIESVVYFKDGKFVLDGSNYSYKDIKDFSLMVMGNLYDNE